MQSSRSSKTVNKGKVFSRHGKHGGRQQVRIVLEKLKAKKAAAEPLQDPKEFFRSRCVFCGKRSCGYPRPMPV